MTGIVALYIFMLAAFTGYEIIAKVPVILHTPLMSGSNFVHGIVLVGAMVALGGAVTPLEKVIGPLNLAGSLAYNASEMYARNLFNFLKPAIDKGGELKIDWNDEVFAGAVLTHDGVIKHEATRKAVEG